MKRYPWIAADNEPSTQAETLDDGSVMVKSGESPVRQVYQYLELVGALVVIVL